MLVELCSHQVAAGISGIDFKEGRQGYRSKNAETMNMLQDYFAECDRKQRVVRKKSGRQAEKTEATLFASWSTAISEYNHTKENPAKKAV